MRCAVSGAVRSPLVLAHCAGQLSFVKSRNGKQARSSDLPLPETVKPKAKAIAT